MLYNNITKIISRLLAKNEGRKKNSKEGGMT